MVLSDMTLAQLDEKRAQPAAKDSGLKVVCMADVEAKPIDWLWPEKFALGKVSMIAGDPGLGKSLITIALASAVSTGARWPVGGGDAPLGSVIMLSDEDAVADTIRPRLDAAGADCGNVHAVTMAWEINDDGSAAERSFSLAKDVMRLAEVVESLPNCVLITIDPITAYLGGVDGHKNAEVRALLSPLSDLAECYNVAVIVVTHFNKGSANAVYRATGSLAFVAAARSVQAVTKDPDDPQRRLMLPIKNNLGVDSSGAAYRVETAENGAPVVMWEPEPVEDIDIDAALNARSSGYRSERQDAADWLASELRSGPVPSKELFQRAKAAGHSRSTLKRAKKEMNVVARKTGENGAWEWRLPNGLPAKCEEDHEGVEEDHRQGVVPFGQSWSPSGDSDYSDEVIL
jgi:hypothetical protein